MNEFVEKSIDVVKSILRKDGYHNPTVFFLRDGELLEIAGFMAAEGVPSTHVWASLAAKGVTMGANAYMVIIEAWMSKAPLDADLSKVTPPSKDPNRVECVAISYFDKDKTKDVMVSIPFIANNTGIEIKEPSIEENKSAHLGGDMFNIFHKAIEIQGQLEAGQTTPQKLLEESRQKMQEMDSHPDNRTLFPPKNPELN